jgi:hypothetical protein
VFAREGSPTFDLVQLAKVRIMGHESGCIDLEFPHELAARALVSVRRAVNSAVDLHEWF